MHPLCLAAFAAMALAAVASAQSSWTTITSPTTQRLNAGCHDGSGLYLAVGDAGTILTSSTGSSWSIRTSGTTQALHGVTYSPALDRYVAVGAQGVVCTSMDGETWAAGTSGVAATLHAVAWGGGRFIAVGDAGTVLTSTDATGWTPCPSGATAGLRGVAWGAGQFVLCGEQGTVLATTDGTEFARRGIRALTTLESVAFDGDRFLVAGEHGVFATATDPHHWNIPVGPSSGYPYYRAAAASTGYWFAAGSSVGGAYNVRSEPNFGASATLPGDIHGLIGGPDAVIAIGSGGSIFRLVPTPLPPSVTVNPIGLSRLGDTFTLEAIPTGTPPFTYQWFRNAEPLTGLSGRTLVFPSLQPTDGGVYYVRVTDRTGGSAEAPGVTVAADAVPPDGIALDRRFSASLPFAPRKIAAAGSNGKVYVAGPMFFYPDDSPQYGVGRLNADGSLDPSFRIASNPFSPLGEISSIEPQDDGSVILVGWTESSGETGFRFLANGAMDTAYVHAPGIPLSGGGTVRMSMLRNYVVTCTRHDAAGDVIDAFEVDLDPDSTLGGLATFSRTLHTIDAEGRIVVAFAAFQAGGTGMFGVNASRLFRLQPDGALDSGFPVASISRGLTGLWCDQATGRFYIRATALGPPMGSIQWTTFARLTANGESDPEYPPFTYSSAVGEAQGTVSTFVPGDNSFLVTSASLRSGELRNGSTVRIVRHGADGTLDAVFRAGVIGLPRDTMVDQIVAEPDGRLLVSTLGTLFARPGTHHLVRLVPIRDNTASRLSNISTRSFAGADSETLIVGFVLSGQGTKTMLVRGIGPGLVSLGVADPLPDPLLRLFAGSSLGLSNDDWSAGSNPAEVSAAADRLGAFALAPSSTDAALLGTFGPGVHTMHVSAARGTHGVGLAEAYDADIAPGSSDSIRVRNFSSRSRAGSGPETLIAGFVIDGPSAHRVLIRAVGPGLVPLNVTGTLANPALTLFAGQRPIATNDDWGTQSDLATVFSDVGAFPLAAGSRDAAMLITLGPGAYTAHVLAADGSSTGVALVEVYEVP